MIIQDELKEQLHYDPETGIFTRKTWCRRTRRNKGARCGNIMSLGYREIRFNGYRTYEHRLAWFYMTGEWPPNQIDHINRIRDDNRFCNLRLADQSLQEYNKGISRRNKTGFKGVSWDKEKNKWVVRLQDGKGKYKHFGRFDNKDEAIAVAEKVLSERQL